MRRGISPVVATVILASIMLTVVSVAIYYSTTLIDMNRQLMEYEYSKSLLAYAASALEQVSFGTGGARSVRLSLSSTGLNFERSSTPLVVSINGREVLRLLPGSVKLCGGSLVTTVPRLLYPETGLLEEVDRLVVEEGEPLAVAYEIFSGRACAVLETYRVRATYSGLTHVQQGLQSLPYNFYVIHVINMSFGRLGGSGTVLLVFRNRGVVVNEYRFDTPVLNVVAQYGSKSSSLTLTGSPSALGSVVIVKVSQVEVGTG
ncbi:MAG: hypothetical protein QXM99_06910 [Thermofilum sp.]